MYASILPLKIIFVSNIRNKQVWQRTMKVIKCAFNSFLIHSVITCNHGSSLYFLLHFCNCSKINKYNLQSLFLEKKLVKTIRILNQENTKISDYIHIFWGSKVQDLLIHIMQQLEKYISQDMHPSSMSSTVFFYLSISKKK